MPSACPPTQCFWSASRHAQAGDELELEVNADAAVVGRYPVGEPQERETELHTWRLEEQNENRVVAVPRHFSQRTRF
jgi:hypothetical protein